MKCTAMFLLVCCVMVGLFSGRPVQATDGAGNTRKLLLDRNSGDQAKTAEEKHAARDTLLSFKSSDEFPDKILNAIKAHFKQKNFVLSNLEKQDTIQMGGKGRIYSYLCKFEGYEKQYKFLFATLYKDASKGELVYKAFFCRDKAEFDDLVEKGEKMLKDTLAYNTPRFSFYKGYEKTLEQEKEADRPEH